MNWKLTGWWNTWQWQLFKQQPHTTQTNMGERMSEAFLGLKLSSWENLFEVIRDKDTQLNSKGNFWAAIQHLETQFETAKREAEYRERLVVVFRL